MSTRIEFELLPSFVSDLSGPEPGGFTFEEVPHEEESRDRSSGEDVKDDLTFFMGIAGRYGLLDPARERALGLLLWTERAKLLRTLRRVKRPSLSREPALGTRPISASSRRRLMRVEKTARAIAAKNRSRRPGGKSTGRALRKSLDELDQARTELVQSNLRLVVWVAKRFRGRGFDYIDLIQEGSLGLMRAVDRFDPRVGARFSTFATHWIQQGIRRAIAERARLVRIPVNRIPEVRQIVHARSRLSTRLGRAPLPEEIANETRIECRRVEELLPAIGAIDSIEARIPGTDKLLKDALEDRVRPTPLEGAMQEETRRAIRTVLHELPRRQRIILAMRHGIEYPRECTLDEIGNALGLSRERIRQVEKVATATVREWIRKHRSELARPV